MSTVEFQMDTSQFDSLLKKVDKDMRGEVAKQALAQGALIGEQQAKINLESQGLHKTGQLGNSIQVYNKTPTSVEFGSRGVIYAAIHEFGGTILPKRAKVLHWVNDAGEDVFALKSVIPARPYIRPVLKTHKKQIEDAIANSIRSYLSGVSAK